MTAKGYRALAVLAEHPTGVRPAEFAAFMWPDSESWRNRQQLERKRGAGVERRAGGYLAWLWKAGVVDYSRDTGLFRINAVGLEIHERRQALERVRGAA